MTTSPPLRAHYGRFLRGDRVLLTGHSHQAWPDCARDATIEAFDDAALHVDDKWSLAFTAADAVREAVAARLNAKASRVALAPNTHELVARFLSALPLARRPKLVTTAGEFHTIHRQLRRLAEEGVAVTFVAAQPADTLAERLLAAAGEDAAAVLASAVLFETSERVPHLGALTAAAKERGTEVLLDAYHAFNVAPFDAGEAPGAFVVGGGYKYAQWGEGACFMVVPEGCALRPVYTGWFADFAHLADRRTGAPVTYGDRPADRFAGSTYDPVSHYRARAVARFFDAQGLDVTALRAISLRQTGRLIDALDGLDLATPRAPERRAGFVAVRVADAGAVVASLRAEGVFVDARGDLVRLGPAPYLTDDELDRGADALRRAAQRP
ncbi:MAG: aminotransferase class V-fold PLP-dependent enzyme [Polyangiales bacterium]